MTPAVAVAITALAAIAYTAASVWAARRQAKWMAEMEQKFKNGDPMKCTHNTFAANKSVITAESAANSRRTQVIARAVAAHDREWPEHLTSRVMFYDGERITKAEFLAEVQG